MEVSCSRGGKERKQGGFSGVWLAQLICWEEKVRRGSRLKIQRCRETQQMSLPYPEAEPGRDTGLRRAGGIT